VRYSTYRYLDRILGSEKEREFCYFPLIVPAYLLPNQKVPTVPFTFPLGEGGYSQLIPVFLFSLPPHSQARRGNHPSHSPFPSSISFPQRSNPLHPETGASSALLQWPPVKVPALDPIHRGLLQVLPVKVLVSAPMMMRLLSSATPTRSIRRLQLATMRAPREGKSLALEVEELPI